MAPISATTFLNLLPGKRVSVTAHGVTVASVLRSGRLANGSIADSGNYIEPQTNIYPVSGAFGKEISAGDLFLVDTVNEICFSVDHINEDTIDRIALLRLEHTIDLEGASIPCYCKATTGQTSMDLCGFTEDKEQVIVTHVSLLPSGVDSVAVGMPITQSDGNESSISEISWDITGQVVTMKAKARGAAKNG